MLKILFILISLVNTLVNGFVPPDILRRFEYKLSFKGPHLVFKDGTIPFWDHAGSAIPSNDQIRITPSIKSQKGRIWCKNKMVTDDWEIDVMLRVNGRGRVGADGMAIWYTDKPGSEGPVFGSNDHWNGLGIFLDSFDNDAQQNNPYIMIMTNDGTKTYDHNRDGITQQLGGCLRDFRNKPFPIHVKVEYYKRILTVYYHGGLNTDLSNYEICARVENVDLPKYGHFGVSAATGGLADDHDVVSFITHSLIDKTAPDTGTLSNEEQKKYDKEYEDFLKQLEVEKEKYRKDHPEKMDEMDEKKVYEAENDRQFRTILDVQNSIHTQIRSLDSKIAEILGRQERMFSMIATTGQGSDATQSRQPPNQQGAIPVDTIRREEVNHLLNQQADLFRTIKDIYASVSDIHRKTNFLHDNYKVAGQPAQQAASYQIGSQPTGAPIDPNLLNQINEGVKSFRFDMANMLSKGQQARCPETTSCLTSVYFLVIIIAQTCLLLAYFIYKSRAENQMKKFY